MLNWDNKDETQKGYEAAYEAILGLLVNQKPVTESEVQKWLDVSLHGIDDHHHIRRHALAIAMRIIRGPMYPPT